jgi:hypothetical protein
MIKPITKDVAGFKKLTGIKVKTAKEITISRIYSILVNYGKDRTWLIFWLERNGYTGKLKDLNDTQVDEVYAKLRAELHKVRSIP